LPSSELLGLDLKQTQREILDTFTGELPYTAMQPQAVTAGMQIYISMPKLPQQHVTSIHKYDYTRVYWQKVVE